MNTTLRRYDDIKALLQEAEGQLEQIKNAYNESLATKEIKSDLKIKIKNYLENLHSALDYIAHDIHDDFTPCVNSHNIYFKAYHNLQSENPDAFVFFQKYHSNFVLKKMSLLVNKKKHDELTPQTRTEAKSLRMEFPGGAVIQMGQGASISGFGQIRSGNTVIDLQGQQISPDNPATNTSGPLNQQVTIWVGFIFDYINEPVFPFLDNCIETTKVIIQDYKKIYGKTTE